MAILNSYKNIPAGTRFERLVVNGFSKFKKRHATNGQVAMFDCTCECGKSKDVQGSLLRKGLVRSCGCLKKELSRARLAARIKPMEDISGSRFGRYTVVKFSHRSGRKYYWLCKCDCGSERTVWVDTLKSGTAKSCGCIISETNKKRFKTHGYSRSETYQNWMAMMQRTLNPNHRAYLRYCGFAPCQFLRTSPLHLVIVIGERPSQEMSLDRIVNTKGYHCGQCVECLEKGQKLNIRWADKVVQARNRDVTLMATIHGVTKSLMEWHDITGLDKSDLYAWHRCNEFFSTFKLPNE